MFGFGFGFEITGNTVLNAPVFIATGLAVGLASQLIGFAISQKGRFSPSQWVAGPAATLAVACFVRTQPGWFGALCAVAGVLLAAVVVSLIRERRTPRWLKDVTGIAVIALCFSVLIWENAAMKDAVAQLRTHDAVTLEKYAATGVAQRFVTEKYVTCAESPVGYETAGNLKMRWSEPVYATKESCIAATTQTARELHGESFAKVVYHEASKGLIEFRKAHPGELKGNAKTLLDSVQS
jgi:hypothetical protein